MTKQQLIEMIQALPDRLMPELETFVAYLRWRDAEATLIPYVSDEEQAEIEAEFGYPANYENDELVDMTDWIKYGNQVSQGSR